MTGKAYPCTAINVVIIIYRKPMLQRVLSTRRLQKCIQVSESAYDTGKSNFTQIV